MNEWNSAESAANDGLAYPFLSISIYLATETSKRAAFGKWFLIGWLCELPGTLNYHTSVLNAILYRRPSNIGNRLRRFPW